MSSAPPRLVVVDDEEPLARLIVRAAEEAGFAATACRDAETFLHGPARQQPEVVILDLNLPGEDGIATLRRLAAQGSRASVIVASAADETLLNMVRTLCDQLGLDLVHCLQKPVAVAELRRLLSGLCTALEPH